MGMVSVGGTGTGRTKSSNLRMGENRVRRPATTLESGELEGIGTVSHERQGKGVRASEG